MEDASDHSVIVAHSIPSAPALSLGCLLACLYLDHDGEQMSMCLVRKYKNQPRVFNIPFPVTTCQSIDQLSQVGPCSDSLVASYHPLLVVLVSLSELVANQLHKGGEHYGEPPGKGWTIAESGVAP